MSPEQVDTHPERRLSLLAEFGDPQSLLTAVRSLREDGFRELATYTPQPVEGLGEALGRPGSWLGVLIFGCGLFGVAWGFYLQYYGSVHGYPVNVGGRPLNSWPAFIPSTFELAVLTAILAAVIGLFAACRLPRYYDPVFALPQIHRSTQNGYMLLVRRHDPRFQHDGVRTRLMTLAARRVTDVDFG